MKKEVAIDQPKYLTEKKFGSFENKFETYMGSIARSFNKIDERFAKQDRAFDAMLKLMQVYTEEAREHREAMSSLMHTDIKQERTVEDLRIRIERLEAKVK